MICTQRSDGLGTRVLSAVYAQLLSEQIGVPVKVIWTPLGWPDPPHSPVLMHPRHILELFDSLHLFADRTQGRYGDIVLHEEVVSTGLFSLFYHQDELFHLSRGEIAQIAWMGPGLNYDFPTPLLQFMARDPDLKEKLARIAACINWNAALPAALDALGRRWPLGECLSVHVRRGDIVGMLLHSDLAILADGLMIQILQRLTPLQAYFNAVDQHRTGGIIVCTEDRAVVDQFARRYGPERIIACVEGDLTENQRAAMDLLLLSKSRRIIAPVVSFFSQCAAAIGSTPLQNTAWRLEETTDEIKAMLEVAQSPRARDVTAIMYAAAYMIALRNDLDSTHHFKTLALGLDPVLFHRVAGDA